MSSKQKKQENTSQTQNTQTSQLTNQSSTQFADPWAPAKSGLEQGLLGLTDWMRSPEATSVYDGPRVAAMSGDTSAGLDRMASGGALPQVQDALLATMRGDAYNPYNKALEDAARARVMQSVNARVSASGMAPGSTPDQALLSRELTQALAPIQSADWNANEARKLQAASMVPGVSQGITQGMIGAGQAREAYDQANIEADIARFNEGKQAAIAPYVTALPYLSQVGGQFGTQSSSGTGSSSGTSAGQMTGNTTTTTTSTPSPLQTVIGAGMMGASLLNPMGGLLGAATSGGGVLGALNAGQLGNVGQSAVGAGASLPKLGMIGGGNPYSWWG